MVTEGYEVERKGRSWQLMNVSTGTGSPPGATSSRSCARPSRSIGHAIGYTVYLIKRFQEITIAAAETAPPHHRASGRDDRPQFTVLSTNRLANRPSSCRGSLAFSRCYPSDSLLNTPYRRIQCVATIPARQTLTDASVISPRYKIPPTSSHTPGTHCSIVVVSCPRACE